MMQVGAHRICKNCWKAVTRYSSCFIHTEWTSSTVRQSFIDFFCQNHDHKYVKSSSLIPTKNQGTYFTNAGMNQFKPIFLDTVDKNHPMADYRRVANSQKCVRVGGKHNDLDDVGKDLYHHTFFEMLGSWSFGDYFKREACSMALELLTTVYKIPTNRLYFTYFGGDSNLGLQPDLETRDIWQSLGISSDRILPFDMKDNFWDMGESGPCGPCTEIHYDYTGHPNSVKLINTGSVQVLEIWNLVFMEYNRRTDGSLEPLNKVHVDTGMGLERLLAVINGTSSTYNTDLFIPLFQAIEKSCKVRPYGGQTDNEIDIAYRIVADHIRMASLCIADGLLPGSKKQGHKLRSVLFRCIHQSKKMLQMSPGSLPSLVDVVVQSLRQAYPELEDNRNKIKDVIAESESWYNQTVGFGETAFRRYLKKYPDQKYLSGEILMELLDGKYSDEGFSLPVEILPDLGDMYKVTVDMEELYQLIEKKHSEKVQVEDQQKVAFSPETLKEIIQTGIKPTDDSLKYHYDKENNVYNFPQGREAVIQTILKDDNLFTAALGDDDFGILLDRTIFYSEGGGQAADIGCIKSNNGVFQVSDVKIYNKYVLHIGTMVSGKFHVGDTVTLNIDEDHRLGCMKNHTATHILNRCLRSLYDNVSQEGSRIYQHKFSFDFSCTTPVNHEDLNAIEENIQKIIQSGLSVRRGIKHLEEALNSPNIIHMANEEYPSEVFIVSLGQDEEEFSTELCGGTHVINTKDIGSFCIISASMPVQGVKQFTCLTGTAAEKAITTGMRLKEDYQELESLVKSEIQVETWLERVKQLNKEILSRLQDSQSSLCTVTTDISLTPQVVRQVLLDVKSSRPIVVVSDQDHNAPIIICFQEEMHLEESIEKEMKKLDDRIKIKKTVKQKFTFLTLSHKNKNIEKNMALCDKLKVALL